MPQNKNVKIYDESWLKTIVEAQAGVTPDYDPKDTFGAYSRVIERQSADFLEDYIAGAAVPTAEASDLLPDYFAILRQSKYHRIVKSLKKAETKYKLEAISRHKEDEKKKAFQATRFKILNSKKEAAFLSSKDMLLIASLLKDEKEYSTVRMQDKLRSFAMEKINRTLRGEMPADEDFAKLADTFGTYQQKRLVKDRIEKGIAVSQKKAADTSKDNRIVSAENKNTKATPANRTPEGGKRQNSEHKPAAAAKKKERKGFFAKMRGWAKKATMAAIAIIPASAAAAKKWTKKAAVVTGLAFVGYFGGKFVQNQFSKADDNAKQNKTEVTVKQQQPVQQKVSKSQKNKESKAADFTKEMSALEKAYKNRFDTALKIILGETARDKLYQQVDSLEKAGKIEYKDGTTREWYAHAFTMYNQLAPNSKENKAVKNLLSGGNEDKAYIHSLVIQSGRDGRGIQASGTYSAFDHADKKLQQQHLKNRKAVKLAEQAALAKAQHTR